MNKKIKAWVAIILSLCMIVGLLPIESLDENLAHAEDEPSLTLGKVSQSKSTEGIEKYYFKDSSGSGSPNFEGLLIVYTESTANPPTINVSSATVSLNGETAYFKVEDNLSTSYSKVINCYSSSSDTDISTSNHVKVSAALVAAYIKGDGTGSNVSFTNVNSKVAVEQEVQFALTKDRIDKKSVFFEGTQHYYQFVPWTYYDYYDNENNKGHYFNSGTCNNDEYTWEVAYEKASEMTFLGYTGYLATIMNMDEDKYIVDASAEVGFLGGTRMTTTTGNTDETNLHYTKDSKGHYFNDVTEDVQNSGFNPTTWYWACGPEIGTPFFNYVKVKDIPDAEPYKIDPKGKEYPYINWQGSNSSKEGEPNESHSSDNKGDGTYFHSWECVLSTLNLGSGSPGIQGTDYSWNDVPINNCDGGIFDDYVAKGFFVEYGNRPEGNYSENSGEDNSYIVKVALLTNKIPQDIVIAEDTFEFGYNNNVFKFSDLKAIAYEVDKEGQTNKTDAGKTGKTLHYEIINDGADENAIVTENGVMKIKKTGTVQIRITADGDSTYSEGKNVFTINIVPKQLTWEWKNPLTYNGNGQDPVPVLASGRISGDTDTECKVEFVESIKTANGKDLNSSNMAQDASEYQGKVKISGTHASYYTFSSTGEVQNTDIKNFTISPKSVEVGWSKTTLVYNGGGQTATASIDPADLCGSDEINLKVTPSAKNGSALTNVGGENVSKNVGNYTATASISGGAGSDNYELTNTTCDYTITQKGIDVLWSDNLEYKYDGTEKKPVATAGKDQGVCDGDTVTLSVTPAAKSGTSSSLSGTQSINVGEYTGTVAISGGTGSGNYKLNENAAKSKDYKILKAAYPTPTPSASAEYTYDGNSHTPAITNIPVGATVYYKVEGAADNTYTTTTPAATNANGDGVNYVYKIVVDDNHEPYVSNFTLKINPKPLTIDWSTTISFPYDKNSHEVTPTLDGVVGTDDVGLTPNLTAEDGPGLTLGKAVNAGGYNVTVSDQLTGTAASNYKIADDAVKSKAFKITPITVGITWNKDLTYNGQNQKPTITLTGVLKGDACTAYVDDSQAKKNANTGDPYSYPATAILQGNDKGNYALPKEYTTTFDIKQKEAELEWTNLSFNYDGEPHTPTASVKNLCEGDDSCSVTLSADSTQTNAGSYTATATGLGDTNYKLPSNPTKGFSISPKAMTDPTVNSTFIYNGDSQTVTVTGIPSDAGDYKIYYKKNGADDSTYTETPPSATNVNDDSCTKYDFKIVSQNYSEYKGDFTLTVNPKEINVSWTNATYIYDGTNQVDDIVVSVPDEMNQKAKPTDTIGLTVTTTKKDETTATDFIHAGSYTATVVSQNPNYVVKTEGGANTHDYTMDKRTVVLSWDKDLTYNGNAQTPTITITNMVPYDDISATVDKSQAVTNASTENDATAVLSGTSISDYKLPDTYTTTFDIKQKSITVNWGTTDLDYTGNEQAPEGSLKTDGSEGALLPADADKVSIQITGQQKDAQNGYTAEAFLTAGKNGDATATSNYIISANKTTLFNIKPGTKPTYTVNGTLEYNGTAQQPEFTNLPSDAYVVYTDDKGNELTPDQILTNTYATNVDDSGITVYFEVRQPNHESAKGSVLLTILPKTVDIDWNKDLTYNGEKQLPTVVLPTGVTFDTEVTVTEGDTNSTDAATDYKATAVSKNSNYVISGTTKTTAYEIKQKEVELTWSHLDDLVYNGQSQKPDTEIKSGVLTKDSGKVSAIVDPNSAKTNAGGPYDTSASLTGDAAKNYKIKSGDAEKKFSIMPKGALPTPTVSSTYTYDGGEHEPEIKGLPDGSTVIYKNPKTGEYDYTTDPNTGKKSSVYVPSLTDAGTESFSFQVYNPNYNDNTVFGPYTLKVNPAPIDVNWDGLTTTYDGSNQTPTASATGVGGVTVPVNVTAIDGTGSPIDSINADTYTVKATSGNPNYVINTTGGKDTASFTINPKPIGISWGITEFTYNGEEQKPKATAVATDVVSGDSVPVTVTANKASINVDDYIATPAIANANYILTAAAQAGKGFSIIPKSLTVNDISATLDPDTFTYTGNSINPVSSGKLTVKDGTRTLTEGTQYTVSVTPQTEVGKYSITVTAVQGGGYKDSITVPWTITNKPTITGVTATPVDCTYDGQDHSITVSGTKTGDVVKYSTSENGPFVTEEIFRRNVTDGTEKIYYTVERPGYETYKSYSTITINPKEIAFDWSNTNTTYNGGVQTPIATPTNLVGSDVVAIVVTGGQKDAGSYTVTADSLTGKDAKNYKLPEDMKKLTSPLNIVPKLLDSKDINANLYPDSFGYTGRPIDATVAGTLTVTDGTKTLVKGKDFIVVGNIETEAGNYVLTIKSADSNKNYSGTRTINWRITNGKEIPGISTTPVDCTYDGQDHSIKVNGTIPGDVVKYSTSKNGPYVSEEIFRRNATNGTETVYFTVDRANYDTYYGSSTITINPRDLEIEWSNTEITYNGKEQKPIATPKNGVTGDNIAINVTGGQTNSGTGYKAEASSISGTNANNYRIPEAIKNILFNINGKPLGSSDITAELKQDTFTYTGNPIDAVTGNLTVKDGGKELKQGTDFIVEGGTQTAEGKYEIIIKPAPGSNYQGERKVSWTISNKPLITGITDTPVNCTYDGQNHSITVNGTLPGDKVSYSTNPNGPFSTDAIVRKDATNGTETVYYMVERDGYEPYKGSSAVTINPKEIGIDWTNTEPVYDGTVKTPVAKAIGLITGDIADITVSGGAIEVGTHTAIAIAINNGNYKLPSNASTQFTIQPAGGGHVHVFDQKVISYTYLFRAGNCVTPSLYYYSCICGEKGTETFEYGGNGHFVYYAGVIKEPTYDEEGLETYHCIYCEYHYELPIPKLNRPEPTPDITPTPEPTPEITPIPTPVPEDPDDGYGDGSLEMYKGYFKDFTTLVLTGEATGENSVHLSWLHHGPADYFIIKSNKCNTETETYFVKEIARVDSSVTTLDVDGLEPGRFYKFVISAWKYEDDGTVRKLGRSLLIDVVTDGGRYTNAEKVSLTGNLKGKKKVTLKVGQGMALEAEITEYQKKRIEYHINMALVNLFRYESMDEEIVKIRGNKMIGVKKGTTDVYVFAQNGAYAKITVTVK